MKREKHKEPKSFDVRRIFLPEDAEQLKELQKGAPEFERHYPQHMQWLDMAINEVLSGKRLAFGVYSLAFNHQHRPTVKLEGCTILKPRKYSSVIEMKNYFIRESSRGRGYGKALYVVAEEYCARSGFRFIETEAPCSEVNTVGFFHRVGFHVREMRISPYKGDEYTYRMEKKLVPLYYGDGFDLYNIAVWLVNYRYGFPSITHVEKGKHFRFEIKTNESTFEVEGRKLVMMGSAIVTDSIPSDLGAEVKQIERTSEDSLLLVVARTADTLDLHRAPLGIKVISEGAIRKAFEHLFAYKPPPFPQSEIGGLIITINPEFFGRLDAICDKPFTYFKTGPVGKYLKPGNKILIFVEPTSKEPAGGIKAMATVRDVFNGSPENIWEAYALANPVFSENEYWAFARNKREVLGIRLEHFERLAPISLEQLANEIIGDLPDTIDLGHYYLSNEMLKRFAELASALNTRSGDFEFDVALSFAGEDRSYAESLAAELTAAGLKVFYDNYEQASLWGKDLYQHLQSVYRDRAQYCVILLSEAYATKLWPQHELKQAQARAFKENREYILPLRLDNTQIPGVNETVGYLDLRTTPITEVAKLLLSKLRNAR